jgi:hypothetical protein
MFVSGVREQRLTYGQLSLTVDDRWWIKELDEMATHWNHPGNVYLGFQSTLKYSIDPYQVRPDLIINSVTWIYCYGYGQTFGEPRNPISRVLYHLYIVSWTKNN